MFDRPLPYVEGTHDEPRRDDKLATDGFLLPFRRSSRNAALQDGKERTSDALAKAAECSPPRHDRDTSLIKTFE